MFSDISILGGGLLGGSLALALARLPQPPRIHTWFRRPESVEPAAAIGIPGCTNNLAEAVHDAKLIVLAVPVGAMPALVADALAAGLPHDCLVTDVGSVKAAPHRTLQPLLAPHGIAFIGSHPMAGSERKGLDAVRSDLFDNAACLLTNDSMAPADLATALENFWQQTGCRTSWMSADDHDRLVARISHLPHLVAASAARICLADPSLGSFGGGGLRDTTRVASGDPSMWAEIVTENRSALVAPLRHLISDLASLLDALETGDQEAARQWLAEAKHLRDQINPLV
jgi:prephenate dehydrogenase